MTYSSSFFVRALRHGVAFGSMALGTACGGSTATEPPSDATALAVTHFGVLGTSWSSTGQASESAPIRQAITDAAAWTTFWKSLAPDPAAGATPPTVDFSTTTVIAAAMAVRPTAGYSVKIERVTEYADYVEAEVVERSPAASCFLAQVVTRPFDIALVPRRDKPVRFTVRATTGLCDAGAADSARVALGKSVDAAGVRVTLRKVESDSRCPTNVVCIWEGDAVATFRFETAGASTDVTLHTNTRAGVVTATVGGHDFSFVALTPYPVAGQAPAESAYTATLVVR